MMSARRSSGAASAADAASTSGGKPSERSGSRHRNHTCWKPDARPLVACLSPSAAAFS